MSEALAFNPHAARAVRTGTWQEQGRSTYRLAAEAVRDGRMEDAIALGRFTMEEAQEGRQLYPIAIVLARSFLLRAGVREDVLAAEEARIGATLRLPDGAPFNIHAGWLAYGAALDAFVEACAQGQAAAALARLDAARQLWRQTHDRACDWLYALITLCARELGEARVGDLWDEILALLYGTLDRYDVARTPWETSRDTLLATALESLRGHLSGPGRMGDVEVHEEEDRWVLRFDPCGSGGRTYRDDPDEGGPPRMEPPYNYAVTTAKHDWAWNLHGICLYCVHCCQLQERRAIQRLGYPIRVVEPPRWPAARAGTKCTWYIYKDYTCVPEYVYERVGQQRTEATPDAMADAP